MTTMLFKPMDDVLNLHREMDRLFESLGVPLWNAGRGTGLSGGRSFFLNEDQENVYAEVAVPGIDPKHIEVTVEDSTLRVSGERPETGKDEKVVRWRLNERLTGRFTQSMSLPVEIDRDKVTAEYKHGILSITLPKAAASKPRQIQVKVS